MDRVIQRIEESIHTKQLIASNKQIITEIGKIADACIHSLKNNGKVLFCGNGGSAADAQHLAAELSGRFYYDRDPLNAEALHVNTSYLTAVGNDYVYDAVFERLVKGKGHRGDVLIGISTSGNSPNVINALEYANSIDMVTVGLVGKHGGAMKKFCEHLIAVPSTDTARIQECHIMVGHILCELIESALFPKAEVNLA